MVRGALLLRGVDLKKLNNRDLLDAAMALLVEPLAGDPERLQAFIDDHLYAPLPGSQESKRKAKVDALKNAGIPDMATVRRIMEERAEAARRAAEAGESEGTPTP